MYNFIREKFQSLLEKAILGSIKSFFWLDHLSNISLYLTKATAIRLSREISHFNTTLMYL